MAEDNTGSHLAWFLTGAALGAAAALLLAPQTGDETREFVKRKSLEGRDRLTEKGREALDKGREYYDRGKELADDAAEYFEKGKQALTRRSESDSEEPPPAEHKTPARRAKAKPSEAAAG